MIFRHLRDSPEPDRGLEKQLRSLEQQAEVALPGFDAQFYNRAGDLCVEAQNRSRALTYYGRAIDAYLRAGRYNAAGAVCRKLLRVSPGSVRARATLAWLSIGKGLLSDAQWEVDEYIEAASAAGRMELARKHLRMMADSTYNMDLRALLASHLRSLGDAEAAERIMEENPAAGAAQREEAEALWSRVLRAALMGPEDLRDID
jgi:tetratricopeptide (TPR) repeat protein